MDTDPQASLTIALGYPRSDDLPTTLTDLMAKVMQDQPIAPKEGILSHEEGVDLVPSNITLSSMEVSLVNAFAASDQALILVQANYLSAKGLEHLLQTVNCSQQAF